MTSSPSPARSGTGLTPRGPSGGREAGRRASAVSPGLLSQQQLGPRDLCRGQPAGQDTSVDRKWGVGDTQGTDARRSGVPLDQWGSPACRLLRAKAPLADACPGHPCCQAQQVQDNEVPSATQVSGLGAQGTEL